MLGCVSSRRIIDRQSLDRSVENPGALIPLGGPEAGGRAGLLRGTDRSLTVAAPFILAKAHGHSLTVAARKALRMDRFRARRPHDPSGNFF